MINGSEIWLELLLKSTSYRSKCESYKLDVLVLLGMGEEGCKFWRGKGVFTRELIWEMSAWVLQNTNDRTIAHVHGWSCECEDQFPLVDITQYCIWNHKFFEAFCVWFCTIFYIIHVSLNCIMPNHSVSSCSMKDIRFQVTVWIEEGNFVQNNRGRSRSLESASLKMT